VSRTGWDNASAALRSSQLSLGIQPVIKIVTVRPAIGFVSLVRTPSDIVIARSLANILCICGLITTGPRLTVALFPAPHVRTPVSSASLARYRKTIRLASQPKSHDSVKTSGQDCISQ
jgi:hypothetical protein